MSNISFMHGNEAAAEGAIAAGCRFYAGYPITPSTEIAEILSGRLPEVGGVFIQMEDEIASIAAVIGASLGGMKSATATSGPGFSLMQENLGFAVASEIPCVIINVQRVGPSTGLPTKAAQGDVMQARWGTHGDHPIIVLTPSTVQEAYTLCMRAFELAERYRTPVVLLMDALVAQLKENGRAARVAQGRRKGAPRGAAGDVQAVRVHRGWRGPAGAVRRRVSLSRHRAPARRARISDRGSGGGRALVAAHELQARRESRRHPAVG